MKVVSIHQPSYFPWFGVLDKIARSDTFIVLDCVQYNKRAFQHRTLYSEKGDARYLSLSVNSKGAQAKKLQINEVTLSDLRVPKKHFQTLRHRYGSRPGWKILEPRFEQVMCNPSTSLLDLNLSTLHLTLDLFGIKPKIVLASDLSFQGSKADLMLSLTQAAGGKVYLSGSGAKAYMNDELFARAEVTVEYQNFIHPEFDQSHTSCFQKGCFALEWFLEDPEGAKNKFIHHLQTTGDQPPRCLVEDGSTL